MIQCGGSPRDQGFDQGRACRGEVRRAAGWWHSGPPGLLGGFWDLPRVSERRHRTAVSREIRRHFPQVSERAAGLARGAGVSVDWVLRGLAQELGDRQHGRLRTAGGLLIGVGPERAGGSPVLVKSVDLPAGGAPPLLLRRTRPDPGFASVELTLPGLPAAYAGVNEAGLAVAITSIPYGPGREPSPPALLLVQECLQRFEHAARAVEFALARRAGGAGTLLLADATGDVAGLAISGTRRRPLAPSSGLLLGAGRETRVNELAARCRKLDPLDAAGLLEALSWHGECGRGSDDSPCRHGDRFVSAGAVWLEPEARRLGFLSGPPCQGAVDQIRFVQV